MIVDVISDLHGFYPKLDGGDLLIVAGDLTGRDDEKEYFEFHDWLERQDYKRMIVIAGNHDNWIEKHGTIGFPDFDGKKMEYLCDFGTEFEGLKIWGSPWSKTFPGMNPHCKAFTKDTDEELAEKWALIPDDIDILITHSPPYGVLDMVRRYTYPATTSEYVGSWSLMAALERVKPRIHVFGHIHEHGGQQVLLKHDGPNTICVNASYVNERYQPANKPVRIILE